MALREIRKFDDPVLRKICRPVAAVDDNVRRLLNDMMDTLHNAPNGGALAACQVGVLKRMVVVDLGEGCRYKLVNPQIVSQRGEQCTPEGCLSFPGVWATVRRPMQVTVKALDENGAPVLLRGKGLLAKCLCHELDHLDGVVFLDKAEPDQDKTLHHT
ncbi:MAG TPA: peptide deformylase [Clostridiales bacterium]|nr:peptide deformylase [Clostridiales bacterium]